MKVVCINSKNKPAAIPAKFWLEEQEIYTVDKVFRIEHKEQKNAIGYTLKELSLPAGGEYESYRADRFRPATDADFEALEAVEGLLEELEIGEFVTL
jgi:hypothetical protein